MTLMSDARSMLAFHEGPLAFRDLHSKVVDERIKPGHDDRCGCLARI
jgi:hypothetical protein